MTRMWIASSLVVASVLACCGLSCAQSKSSLDVQEVLKWFPADTDAVIVSQGPFPLANLSELADKMEHDEPAQTVLTDDQLTQLFEVPAMVPWAKHPTTMSKRLTGERILFAVQGSRRNRENRLEFCSIVIFERGSLSDRLLDSSAGPPLRPEDIDGHGFWVFSDATEDGRTALVVAQPRSNVLLIAENLNYLKSVWTRAHGKRDGMFLSETLPQWRYVDTNAQFWGISRVRHSNSEKEPSSLDEEERFYGGLVGVTFSLNLSDRKLRMVIMSTEHDFYRQFPKQPMAFEDDEDVEGVSKEVREIEPGVVESTSYLKDQKSALIMAREMAWFFFLGR